MIKIDNVPRPEDAAPLETLLNGQTYLDLEVLVCPVGGSCDVLVQSRRKISNEELQNTVLNFLASSITLGDLK